MTDLNLLALRASLTEMIDCYGSDDGGGPIGIIERAKAALAQTKPTLPERVSKMVTETLVSAYVWERDEVDPDFGLTKVELGQMKEFIENFGTHLAVNPNDFPGFSE